MNDRNPPIDPRDDLAGFISQSQDDGSNEADPYSYAIIIIRTALEFALDDGIVGSMNEMEAFTLRQLAAMIAVNDPASAPNNFDLEEHLSS